MDWKDWRLHVSAGLLLVALLLCSPVYLLFLLLAILCGAALAVLPAGYERRKPETYPSSPEPRVEAVLSRIKAYPPPTIKPTLLSVTVDARLQEVIDLTLMHYVIPLYQSVAKDEDAFFHSVMPEIWSILAGLVQRMGQIDTMKLISQDTVEALRVHLGHFHGMHFRNPHVLPKFPHLDQFPYLESPERELNFLRQACEALLCVCLRKELLECTPIRVLIREHLACNILQPTIETICDPDYINQKLLMYLQRKEEATKSAQKKYAYSATYEDFMKHIKKCEDVDELREIRQLIITDIIQAKAVYRMKTSRATGIHGGHFPIPIPAEKAKSLMERNLELYQTQLGTAKTLCERQIRKLGGEEDQHDASPLIERHPNHGLPDVPLGIPFETVMKNEVARAAFLHFLELCHFPHLLKFWTIVHSLGSRNRDVTQKVIVQVYEEYLGPSAPSAVYANPDLVRSLEEMLTRGEEDPPLSSLALLQEIQGEIYNELHDQFYHSFIVSESYRELMVQEGGGEGAEGGLPALAKLSEPPQSFSPVADDDSRYKVKLKSLKQQLEEKEDELAAMPERIHSSPLAQRRKALHRDRTLIEEEIKKLEHYIDHTEEWFGTIGKWGVEIHSVDVSKDEKNDKNPLFIIVVTRPEVKPEVIKEEPRLEERPPPTRSLPTLSQPLRSARSHTSLTMCEEVRTREYDIISGPESPIQRKKRVGSFTSLDGRQTPSESSEGGGEIEGSRAGWVVGRRLSEFQDLHSKVSQILTSLQFPPLPKKLIPFQKPDAQSSYWQKYRRALQSYLCAVLQDERLQESEDVFNFLSPASEHLRRSSLLPPERKRHSFAISVPFRKDPDDSKEDSVAEHVYQLLSEVFELDDWSRVLRKQLMELVQLTFGKSIDRELQEFMNWVISEPMLVFYLETFRNAMWPNGKVAPPLPTRSDEQKSATKEEARRRFMKSGPQALQTVLGQSNCQIGYQKIFDSLQDPRANKELFYALFEVLLAALVPELEGEEIEETWKAEF